MSSSGHNYSAILQYSGTNSLQILIVQATQLMGSLMLQMAIQTQVQLMLVQSAYILLQSMNVLRQLRHTVI